jgi:hypothetical protein
MRDFHAKLRALGWRDNETMGEACRRLGLTIPEGYPGVGEIPPREAPGRRRKGEGRRE